MRIRLIAVGVFVGLGACAPTPSIRDAAVLPLASGTLAIGAPAPPADSFEVPRLICMPHGGQCPARHRYLYYTTGLSGPIDRASAEEFDSTVGTLVLGFEDSMSVEMATRWIQSWLRRNPRTQTPTVVEWKDGKYGVHLEAGSGWRPTAVVFRLEDRGHRRPAVPVGEQWRICTEVDVSLCPLTRRIGDWSSPYP